VGLDVGAEDRLACDVGGGAGVERPLGSAAARQRDDRDDDDPAADSATLVSDSAATAHPTQFGQMRYGEAWGRPTRGTGVFDLLDFP
jgi:hypothetical protein